MHPIEVDVAVAESSTHPQGERPPALGTAEATTTAEETAAVEDIHVSGEQPERSDEESHEETVSQSVIHIV